MQIDNGTIASPIGGSPALFVAFYEDSGDFREVIVATKNTVSIPCPAADLGAVGASGSYTDPQDAESAGKTYLDETSNYQLDRWWVKSNSPIDTGLSSYPSPQNDGYSFVKAVKVIRDDDDADLGLLAYYSKTISSTRRDYIVLVAGEGSTYSAIPSVGSRFEDHSMSNPSGSDFDDEAESIFGQGNYNRATLDETIKKLAAYENFPASW